MFFYTFIINYIMNTRQTRHFSVSTLVFAFEEDMTESKNHLYKLKTQNNHSWKIKFSSETTGPNLTKHAATIIIMVSSQTKCVP